MFTGRNIESRNDGPRASTSKHNNNQQVLLTVADWNSMDCVVTQTNGRAFSTLGRAFQTLGRAFDFFLSLQKLG